MFKTILDFFNTPAHVGLIPHVLTALAALVPTTGGVAYGLHRRRVGKLKDEHAEALETERARLLRGDGVPAPITTGGLSTVIRKLDKIDRKVGQTGAMTGEEINDHARGIRSAIDGVRRAQADRRGLDAEEKELHALYDRADKDVESELVELDKRLSTFVTERLGDPALLAPNQSLPPVDSDAAVCKGPEAK